MRENSAPARDPRPRMTPMLRRIQQDPQIRRALTRGGSARSTATAPAGALRGSTTLVRLLHVARSR